MEVERLADVLLNGRSHPIQLRSDHNRFEIRVDEHVAFLLFHLRGTVIALIHTEVPPALRRQGVADALARTSLEYARSHSLTVKVLCPFVKAFLARHPEFQDLVKTDND